MFNKINLRFKKEVFDKYNDVSKIKTKEFDLPLVNAKNGDNGVMYYGRSSDFESATMTIDIVNDGAVSTGDVYSQPQETGVLYNAYLIKPKFVATTELLHFFTACIFKSIKLKFGYENKAGWDKVKNEKIFLPIRNKNIDYNFMESLIAKLEAEHVMELETKRVTQLEAYLKVSGFDNYELSDEEKDAIKNYNQLECGEFKLETLFEKLKTNSLKYKTSELPNKKIDKYCLPALTAGIKNQGLNNYVPIDGATVLKKVISISANGANTGATFYQNTKFTVLQDAYAIKWAYNNLQISDNQYLFLASCISTAIYGSYEWTNKAGWTKVKQEKIQLPIRNSKIDFEFMEIFVSAIQKLVIKDVNTYANKKINAAKACIPKS